MFCYEMFVCMYGKYVCMYVRMYVCIYVIVLLMYVNACFVCNVFCVWYVCFVCNVC